MVVDGQVYRVPANAPVAVESAVAGDAVAHSPDAPKLLDVDVQQLPRVLALVTHHGYSGLQRTQPREPHALHASTHGGQAASSLLRDAPQWPALAA